MDPQPKDKTRKQRKQEVLNSIAESIRNKDKTKKPRYFYIRDQNNLPTITVCEIEFNSNRYRGVSICSPLDQPYKKTGRKIAFDRAVASILNNKDLLPICRSEAILELEEAGIDTYKGREKGYLFKAKVNPSKEPSDDIIQEAFQASRV